MATFPACHVDYWIISIEKSKLWTSFPRSSCRYQVHHPHFSTVTVAQSVFSQSLDHLGNVSLETNGDLGYLHFRKPPPSRAPCWPCYWPYWRCACWPCSWPSQDPRQKKGGKGGEIHVESKTMWMEVYWWEKRGYIQQGWGNWRDLKAKMEFVQKPMPVTQSSAIPGLLIWQPIMNHAPLTNFVIWSVSKKHTGTLFKKNGPCHALSLDYSSMWYSLHRGKKNRSAAVNPHRTSSSRGDLQSVLQVDNPTCARTL